MSIRMNNNEFNQLKFSFSQLENKLKQEAQPEYLNERIYLKYYQWVARQLAPIFNTNYNEQTTILSLQDFFTRNEPFIKNTLLSPTAIHDSDVMILLCKIAPLVCGNKKPVELLFGEIQWESMSDNYPDLDETITLELIIKTHIISDNGKTLIPVKCLTEENQLEDYHNSKNPHEQHYNPYDSEYAKLSKNEIKRLIEHSKTTEELNSTVALYHKLINEKAYDLYSQLDKLCRLLRVQDAYGGRGTQEQSGEGTFIALTQFIEFYDKLSEQQKSAIPSLLKESIDTLIKVASEYKGIMASRVETCSADRRKDIEKAMKGHEQELAKITLEGDELETQKQKALELKLKHLKDLKQVLDNNTYQDGYDKLGFNRKLLHDLELNCRIRSPRDLDNLKKLSANEIKELITDNTLLQTEIIDAIETLENFIMFTHEVNREVLNILLEILGPQFLTEFVNNAEDFQALLMTHYEPEIFTMLFNCFNQDSYVIRNDLFDIQQINIIAPIKFKRLDYLKQSTAEEIRTILVKNMPLQSEICTVLSTKTYLSLFILELNHEQLSAFLEIMAPEINRFIINNESDFYYLISQHHDKNIFALLVHYLHQPSYSFIKTSLSEEQATTYKQIRFPKLLTLKEEKADAISELLTKDPEFQTGIIKELSNPSDLSFWVHELSIEQLSAIFYIIGKQLSNTVVKDFSSFGVVIRGEHDNDVFELLVTHFDKPIFPKYTYKVSEEQVVLRKNIRFLPIKFLFEKTVDEIKSLLEEDKNIEKVIVQAIGDVSYLSDLIEELDTDKLPLIYEISKTHFKPQVDTGGHQLRVTLKDIHEEKRFKLIFEWFDDATIIFSNYLQDEIVFTPDQWQWVCESIDARVLDKEKFLLELRRGYITRKGIKAFVDGGGDINDKNTDGDTPLLLALRYHANTEIITGLLINGANIRDCDVHGNSTFYTALFGKPDHSPWIAQYDYFDSKNYVILLEHYIKSKKSFAEIPPCTKNEYINLLNYHGLNINSHDFKNQLVVFYREEYVAFTFLESIQLDSILSGLLGSKISCDKEVARGFFTNRAQEKSDALADLLKDLITLRRNLITANAQSYNEAEFIDNCLTAIHKARPALQEHRDIMWLLTKFVLCLLIVPIFILYYTGQLTIKTNSQRQVDKLESALIQRSFFQQHTPEKSMGSDSIDPINLDYAALHQGYDTLKNICRNQN